METSFISSNYFAGTIASMLLLLCLYYIFHVVPFKNEQIRYWKKQTEKFRDMVQKVILDHETKDEKLPRYIRDYFNPGPPADDGAGAAH